MPNNLPLIQIPIEFLLVRTPSPHRSLSTHSTHRLIQETKAATSHIANSKKKSQDVLVTLMYLCLLSPESRHSSPDRRVLVRISGIVQTVLFGVPAYLDVLLLALFRKA